MPPQSTFRCHLELSPWVVGAHDLEAPVASAAAGEPVNLVWGVLTGRLRVVVMEHLRVTVCFLSLYNVRDKHL